MTVLGLFTCYKQVLGGSSQQSFHGDFINLCKTLQPTVLVVDVAEGASPRHGVLEEVNLLPNGHADDRVGFGQVADLDGVHGIVVVVQLHIFILNFHIELLLLPIIGPC